MSLAIGFKSNPRAEILSPMQSAGAFLCIIDPRDDQPAPEAAAKSLLDSHDALQVENEALRAKVVELRGHLKAIAEMADTMRSGCDEPGEITCPVLVTIWDAAKEFPE